MANAAPDYELGFELYEILPDAIFAVDRQGVIRYANRQAGRLFGQEPSTPISTPVETLLPEHLRERHLAHRAKYNLDPRRRPMGRGLLHICWWTEGETFRMRWTERDGPQVSPSPRRGFGTIVMQEMAERSVGGKVDLDYAPSGVTWRLTCPAAKALEPTG